MSCSWNRQDSTKIHGRIDKRMGKYMPGMSSRLMNFEMYSRYMKEIHIRTVPKIKNPTSGGFGITKTHKEKCHAN